MNTAILKSFLRHSCLTVLVTFTPLLPLAPLAGAAADAQNATNAPPSTNAAPAQAAATNATVAPAPQPGPGAAPGDAAATPDAASDEIQLSLQGANIDMVVQWLAQNTGKTVIKHPRAMCQLTINSSKKMKKREAINLLYRALALEGFSATEMADTIFITPEGQEPKISPQILTATNKEIPEGRQRMVKFFDLRYLKPGDAKERLVGVLSEKGTMEADERRNQLIVTDYTDNLRVVGELLEEFDVSESDLVMRIFALQHVDAEEAATLMGAVLNGQPATVGSGPSGRSSGSSGPGGTSVNMPPGVVISGSSGPGGMPGGGAAPASSGGTGPGIGSQVTGPQVRIWPDKTANRLIVSAAKGRLTEIQRLIDLIDTEQGQDVTLRILPLKNVGATDLARELAPLYQKMGGKSRRDVVEVAANDRSNSLFILSSESNFKAIQALINSLDTEEAQEKAIQTFVLKNADAQDVAKQLQELTRDQDSSSRYGYVFFGPSFGNDRNRQRLSVVADRRRNSLIVQAPPSQMDGIAKMINELDEPVSGDTLAPKIYHLKYVSATDVEDVLNELFTKKQQDRSYFYYFDDYMNQSSTDRDVGRLYGKVRITSEPISNTLIITSNSKESLAAVENVLNQLDQPSEAGESTLHIGLRFAKAPVVANSINILFAKNGSPPLRGQAQPGQPQAQPQFQPQQQQNVGSSQVGFDLEKESREEGYYPWLGGQPDSPRSSDGRNTSRPVSDLVGRVRAVADPRSNSLLVTANVHYFPQIMKLIDQLDAQTDQVLIEARLLEVAADYLDRLGVRWSPDGTQVFTKEDLDNSLIVSSKGQYQSGFGGKTDVNTPAISSGSVAQTITSLRSGVVSSTMSLDFLIQFLKKTTDAKVLAEPQLNIRDNETGRLFVGQQVPIPSNNQVSGLGTTTTSFTYKDVGVKLEVTPHINSEGDVELQIHAEASIVVPGVTVLGGSVFDTRNFRTDLTAKHGETLVLGGIIQRQISDTLRKTPVLGDIPGLGWAFKKKDTTTRDVQLMVFLRPKVIRGAADARKVLEDIYQKSPRVEEWYKQNEAGPASKEPAATNF